MNAHGHVTSVGLKYINWRIKISHSDKMVRINGNDYIFCESSEG